MSEEKKNTQDAGMKGAPLWFIHTIVEPKEGQYLKTAFVKFDESGTPIHYYTLHNPAEAEK